MNVRETIRRFLAENFLLRSGGLELDNDASLLEAGVIDSTGILELTLFVEETFKLKITDEEISPENFDSVNRIAAYIASKAAGVAQSA